MGKSKQVPLCVTSTPCQPGRTPPSFLLPQPHCQAEHQMSQMKQCWKDKSLEKAKTGTSNISQACCWSIISAAVICDCNLFRAGAVSAKGFVQHLTSGALMTNGTCYCNICSNTDPKQTNISSLQLTLLVCSNSPCTSATTLGYSLHPIWETGVAKRGRGGNKKNEACFIPLTQICSTLFRCTLAFLLHLHAI